MRIPLPWRMVEPSKGEYNWDYSDQIVQAAEAKGVEVLFVLRANSPWGTKKFSQNKGGYHSSSSPKKMQDWVEFLELLAKRYKNKKVYYEIENEINAKTFWSGTKEEYISLLNASYEAIKKGNSNTKVLCSAFGCGITRKFKINDPKFKKSREFLKAILATKSFDVVSVHNYYFPGDIVINNLTFISYLNFIRNVMQDAQVADTPIWITETGYVSQPAKAQGRKDIGTLARQALWLKEAYDQAFSTKIERVFWLIITDRNEPYFGSMGLMNVEGMRKPAWDIMQEFVK
jgi:hypothetical protein